MKLKKDYVLRQVADTWTVLPLGDAAVDFNGMLTLNSSGAMLWNVLEQGGGEQELVDALTAEYDVSAERAAVDIQKFLDVLRCAGCIEE